MDYAQATVEAKKLARMAAEAPTDHWYVLFVMTGYEAVVRDQLSCFHFRNEFGMFVPTRERIIKLPGVVKKECKPIFPGYLFIETDMSTPDFIGHIRKVRWDLQKILKPLRYGESHEYAVFDGERRLLDALLNKARCIEASVGIIKGDRVIITEGPLVGQESIIRKIDRHKRKATIEVPLFGAMRRIEVALEIVERM
jgi:transcriptional antiterminator NusG